MKYRQQLELLKKEVLNSILDIRKNFSTITFLTDEEIENGECDDYLEVRNDITGNVFDVHLVSISPEGIKVVEADDTTRFHTIGVHDFATIEDKINLYEMLLEKIGTK